MIYSTRFNCGYQPTPKCANSSIKTAILTGHGMKANWPHRIGNDHLITHRITHRYTLTPSMAGMNWFRFCVVRNPWDRVLSCFRNKIISSVPGWRSGMEDEYRNHKDFSSFVRAFVTVPPAEINIHLRPLAILLHGFNFDLVCRFERLAEDWKVVQAHTGLGELPHRNRTSTGETYHALYTDETRKLVGEYYAVDVDAYGYHFD